ncbi:MAG: hypothetical protein JWN18_728 [Parcubacteria group bacterium]|nr:hypothetical protein [Parcubacteria group bacterium]
MAPSHAVETIVGMGRLELPRIAPYASETYAYTSSATCPAHVMVAEIPFVVTEIF